MSDNIKFKNGDEEQEISLGDLAGLDMSGVEEKHFTVQPAGVYEFKCLDAKLGKMETVNGETAVVQFEMEIVNCHAVIGEKAVGVPHVPEDQIGKKYTETFFLTTSDSLGYLKGFMSDTGFTGSGTLQQMLDAFHGHAFIGAVKHTKDKNDADKVYTNLAKCKPLAVTEVAAGAQAAGAGTVKLGVAAG